MQYYLLTRERLQCGATVTDTQIVSCVEGANPLHGYGSYDIHSGPFASREEAEKALDNAMEAMWIW
jgi:hypothetical protein